MARKEKVEIVLTAKDRTKAAFNSASRSVKSFGSLVSQTFGRLGTALGLGGVAAGGGIAVAVANLTQELDALGKTAKGLNATVEGLSALQYAVERTSTLTGEQFATTLQKLVKHIGSANRGAKESQKIFQELGLSWEYLATLDSDKAFIEVADAISKMDDKYKAASVTQKIFEDRWRDITATIQEGREGITALTDEARELGVPTDEAAEAAARLNDQMRILSQQMQGVSYTYGPPIIEFFSYWTATLTGASGLNSALDQTIDKMARLEGSIAALEGHGTWFDDFWTAFLTDAEKAPIVEAMKNEVDDLSETLDELAIKKEKAEKDAAAAAEKASAETKATAEKPKATKAGKPVKSTGDQLVDNRLARQRKEISQDEYRKRRSEIIRGSNPAGDIAALNPASSGSITPSFEVSPVVSEDFKKEIERAVEAAMSGTTYTMKVKPELAGLEGTEIAARDQADKEGVRAE